MCRCWSRLGVIRYTEEASGTGVPFYATGHCKNIDGLPQALSLKSCRDHIRKALASVGGKYSSDAATSLSVQIPQRILKLRAK
jgi:hypothetical protein